MFFFNFCVCVTNATVASVEHQLVVVFFFFLLKRNIKGIVT